MALLLMVRGDINKAQRHLQEALQINPKYREALLNLGFLYIEQKSLDKAERIFLSLAKEDPRDAFLQHLLGIFYLLHHRPKDAWPRIQKAIQLHPFYQEDYKRKGLLRRGKIVFDANTLQKMKKVKLNYHHSHFYFFLSNYYAQKGNISQAIKPLKRATLLKPNEALFHNQLGSIYYYKGDYPKAIKEFKKALKIDPFNGIGHAHLSYTYGVMGKGRKALPHTEKAVDLYPSYADLHYHLALLYSDQKRHREAISELKKAIRINPNYLFAKINLGVLYEEQKRWKEAKREYETILKITPEDESVRKRLEKILPR